MTQLSYSSDNPKTRFSSKWGREQFQALCALEPGADKNFLALRISSFENELRLMKTVFLPEVVSEARADFIRKIRRELARGGTTLGRTTVESADTKEETHPYFATPDLSTFQPLSKEAISTRPPRSIVTGETSLSQEGDWTNVQPLEPFLERKRQLFFTLFIFGFLGTLKVLTYPAEGKVGKYTCNGFVGCFSAWIDEGPLKDDRKTEE